MLLLKPPLLMSLLGMETATNALIVGARLQRLIEVRGDLLPQLARRAVGKVAMAASSSRR
jgi:hypothetical protein